MALNPRRIGFSSFQDMAGHLDRWAEASLTGPDHWEDAVVSSTHWLDYSARNQVLLDSYGVDGPVAGPETWRLVASAIEGRDCAVRAGEHGYPVRVPITTTATEPDPYLGGNRPTRSAVERWEWRPVFSVGQLARRPAPETLSRDDLPAALVGAGTDDGYLAAVRKVASATVRGRLPKSSDPETILAEAAGRLPRSAKRPELEPDLRRQVAWLVADRVNRAPGPLPAFDPSHLRPRERWERLQDVLDPARKLTAGLGVAVGVDLCASPLPRMEIVDDRVVPAGRRHRLPAASFDALPVGRWVTAGPYTTDEWASRGEAGSGLGAYLRLNKSAYLVAVETGVEASWRLEDVSTRTGDGMLTRGSAPNLEDAQADALATVRTRYPALASVPERSPSARVDVGTGWEPMPGRGRSSAELRRLNRGVTIYAIPAPGGRWMPAVSINGHDSMDQLPSVRTRSEARDVAELTGRRMIRLASVRSPVEVDEVVAELAGSTDYSRRELQSVIGGRLLTEDRGSVVDASPEVLVELLGRAGVTPASTVAVLDAEGTNPSVVAPLLPVIGVPIADGVRVLHDRWNLDVLDAAELLDATALEMRQAGCTPMEIMAARPREVMRALPDDPHLWELAAGTMATAGHSTATVAQHLVAHSPTSETFAAGLVVIAPEPGEGLALASRYGAPTVDIAAASERYGLSPTETATVLADTGTSPQRLVETIWHRCDHEASPTRQIATDAGRLDADTVDQTLAIAESGGLAIGPITALAGGTQNRSVDLTDADSLLATLPDPVPSTDPFAPSQLDHLAEPTTLDARHLSGAQP